MTGRAPETPRAGSWTGGTRLQRTVGSRIAWMEARPAESFATEGGRNSMGHAAQLRQNRPFSTGC